MFIIFICVNVSLLIFGVVMVLSGKELIEDLNQKLEIQQKLIESIEQRLNNHKL